MAVSACGEGCHTHMEQMLNNIVDAVLPFAVDPVSNYHWLVLSLHSVHITTFNSVWKWMEYVHALG